MKLHFIFGGGKTTEEASPLLQSFLVRTERYFPAQLSLIASKQKSSEDIKNDESERILKLVSKADRTYLFDERGKEISSTQLAKLLEKDIEHGAKEIAFIVGGAYGVSDTVRDAASMVISFSPMIFPHQLARIMTTEQVYRALDIIRGGKYHHE